MAEKDELGRAGEDRAAAHLERSGWRLLDRRWRCAAGEIDIVGADGRDLVVVEVKTRSGPGFGDPLAAVDGRKKARLWRLGMAWAAAHPDDARGRTLRLDVIGIMGTDPARADLVHLRDVR